MVFWHTRAEPKALLVFWLPASQISATGTLPTTPLIASCPWFALCNLSHSRPHARVNPSGISFLLLFFIDPCGAMEQQNTAMPLPPDLVACFCKCSTIGGWGAMRTSRHNPKQSAFLIFGSQAAKPTHPLFLLA